MSAPSVGLLENAAEATFWGNATTAFGLAQLNGPGGAPLQVTSPNGCTAAAFSDGAGNVIISFQGTQTVQQSQADQLLMTGVNGSRIPAFQDAVAFTRSVEQVAASMGVPSSSVYVTGHSLGGALAEYVASKTGLGGASFAGAGIPGYQAPSAPAANFVSYVEHGDSFANWASDASEHALIAPGVHQDHYGQLAILGSPSQDVLTNTIISDYQALIPAIFDGQLGQAVSKLATDFTNNLFTIHGMNHYGPDIGSLPPPNFAPVTASSGLHALQRAVASTTPSFHIAKV